VSDDRRLTTGRRPFLVPIALIYLCPPWPHGLQRVVTVNQTDEAAFRDPLDHHSPSYTLHARASTPTWFGLVLFHQQLAALAKP
jgi:hypothetical protein